MSSTNFTSLSVFGRYGFPTEQLILLYLTVTCSLQENWSFSVCESSLPLWVIRNEFNLTSGGKYAVKPAWCASSPFLLPILTLHSTCGSFVEPKVTFPDCALVHSPYYYCFYLLVLLLLPLSPRTLSCGLVTEKLSSQKESSLQLFFRLHFALCFFSPLVVMIGCLLILIISWKTK